MGRAFGAMHLEGECVEEMDIEEQRRHIRACRMIKELICSSDGLVGGSLISPKVSL